MSGNAWVGAPSCDTPLDLSPIETPTYTPEMSLADRYAAWIARNPHVLDVFERLAEQWFAAGHERVGCKFLAEQARWISGVRTSGEPWTVNNSHVAFLSRDLLARRPEWSERIATRTQRAAA